MPRRSRCRCTPSSPTTTSTASSRPSGRCSSEIRVNAIAPGPFPAPAAQADTSFMSRLAERTMVGRIGRPEELAAAVLYLATPASSFTTGAVLPVDGGWTAW
ncbi:MAG TPA: SDR family oxidoreductase [Brevibacterium sp.]|nr:SDR family oxidoreductase [Brevibacterium sp.]